ncbi:hypothetical protein GGR53DRAFT_529929 [Hypoxylon sp. FL1150]|nr:hypothetical protein GGR53DRAFT_529929 [Hypoxylon sp. FL1150]
MASLFTKTLLLTAVGGAVLQPRQKIDDACCFNLASIGTADNIAHKAVVESHIGNLILGGSFQEASLCLDRENKTIKDGLKHNCFFDRSSHEFNCYQGAVGNTTFDTIVNEGKTYLSYDDGAGSFYACPVGDGTDQYYLYSDSKDDADGCELVSLELSKSLDTCLLSSEPEMNTNVKKRHDGKPSKDNGTATIPVECIPKAQPQYAPLRTSIRNEPTDQLTYNTWGAPTAPASITPTNATTFYFELPSRQRTPASKHCALQFRLPRCADLPEGYPCYRLGGVERELDHGAGFTVSRVGALAGWNDGAVHQVHPGKTTTVGVFECGLAAGPQAWFARSVNGFELEFAQAGVGPDARFEDGVGAWIVECMDLP